LFRRRRNEFVASLWKTETYTNSSRMSFLTIRDCIIAMIELRRKKHEIKPPRGEFLV
jgi:hypothetical protein